MTLRLSLSSVSYAKVNYMNSISLLYFTNNVGINDNISHIGPQQHFLRYFI